MILQSLCLDYGKITDLHELLDTTSIWTIDLAYLLKRFRIQDFSIHFLFIIYISYYILAMYTSYIGINLQHAHKKFYKESLSLDRKRIHSLFANASDRQIRIVPLILDLDDIKRFLFSCRYCIILLVNVSSPLKCISCKRERSKPKWWWNKEIDKSRKSPFNTCTSTSTLSSTTSFFTFSHLHCCVCTPLSRLGRYELLTSEEFTGHYILLVGYDVESDIFYYRDPGVPIHICCIKSSDLECARGWPGTDHDAIVVKIR